MKAFGVLNVFVVVPSGYKVWNLYVYDGSGWEIATSNGINEDALAKGAATLAHGSPWVILGFSRPHHEQTEFRVNSGDCPTTSARDVEEARQSWVEHQRAHKHLSVPKQCSNPPEPPGVQGSVVVDEKDKPVPCGFCEEPAKNPLGTPHCGVNGPHSSAAILHDRRLLTGGLVDCSETRAESLRFAERHRAQLESDRAAVAGYRTQNDLAKGVLPTVTERASREPPEAIPLAGSTPHYEWP
jgi:hypothetical protein